MKTIFQAVIDGDLDEIRKLRAQGQIDINALNEQGDSALIIAIKKEISQHSDYYLTSKDSI